MPSLSCLRKLPSYSCYVCNLPTKARTHLEHTGFMQSAKASNSKCIYFIVKVKAWEVILAFANQLLQNSLSYKGF